jgi:hypothetical protein
VRDLWTREDLGEFQDSFTAHDLAEHEHRVIKVGKPGPPLPAPSPMPLDKYTATRAGETYLSDLYYVWKRGNPPAYDRSFNGEPIHAAGHTFRKGIGAKRKGAVMFMVDGRGGRFRATVAMDDASPPDATGRFRVHDEDFFSNKVLWDSGPMKKDSSPKEIDVALEDVRCLMLVFDGKEALGNWADAHVVRGSADR